jgi:hypothetical protein
MRDCGLTADIIEGRTGTMDDCVKGYYVSGETPEFRSYYAPFCYWLGNPILNREKPDRNRYGVPIPSD